MPHKRIREIRKKVKEKNAKARQREPSKLTKKARALKEEGRLTKQELSGLKKDIAANPDIETTRKAFGAAANAGNTALDALENASEAASNYETQVDSEFDEVYGVDADSNGTVGLDEVFLAKDLDEDGDYGPGEVFQPVFDDGDLGLGLTNPTSRQNQSSRESDDERRDPMDDILI